MARHAVKDDGSPHTDVLSDVLGQQRGRILSVLIGALRDFDLAEDALQEAVAVALATWPKRGVPPNPAGWLVTTARRRGADQLRRAATFDRKHAELSRLAPTEAEHADPPDDEAIADQRLRLIFTCCHPALELEARVALTLHTLAGLTTPQIARAFLTTETAMAQRLVRVKRRIRDTGIPYCVPDAQHMAERLAGVLAVLYLIFNEGYSATTGDTLVRADMAAEAIRLARMLAEQLPDEPEVLGLLALMLFHDARRDARTGADGSLLLLGQQDRTLWYRVRIREANQILRRCAARDRPGPYQIQGAIAGLHANAPTPAYTNWRLISELYDRLIEIVPTPVVALNRVVAYAMADGPAVGLSLIHGMEGMERYHLYHATRGDLLRQLARHAEAAEAYRRALECVGNSSERRFLERRLAEVCAEENDA